VDSVIDEKVDRGIDQWIEVDMCVDISDQLAIEPKATCIKMFIVYPKCCYLAKQRVGTRGLFSVVEYARRPMTLDGPCVPI